MRSARRLALVCALTATACAGGAAATGDPAPDAGPTRLFAQVENQNEFTAHVFAYRTGRWTELGFVEPGQTKLFPFEWDRPEVRFVIELVGNDAVTDLGPEQDARKTFAADVRGTVPCHLTASNRIEPNLVLVLDVQPELRLNAGGSRCEPRR